MTPTRRVRAAVALTKVVAVATLCAITAITTITASTSADGADRSGVSIDGATGTEPSTGVDASAPAPGRARIDRLKADHHCSTTGFGPDVVPGSAIVKRGRHVVYVSFDQGWASYSGAAPGTLVAVCLDPR